MEKTVLVAVYNNFSSYPSSQCIGLELALGGKPNKASNVKSIPKSVWTCCVEAVSEYCRVVLDIFPDQYQVCVAAVDETKCQPINSWRDEDQQFAKVLSGFQTFGSPVFQSIPATGRGGSSHLSPCMQGLQYAVRCLAQLTATQYATTTNRHSKKPTNKGRIIFMCSLKNDMDVKELEKSIVNLVKVENADIKQKQDQARLHIHECQMVLVNAYSHTNTTSTVKDSPLTQLSSVVSSVVYSFPGILLLEKSVHLAKMHFDLKSTIITGIPMKEEQAGGSSANYDVELIHLSEAHRDILRAGYLLGSSNNLTKKDSQQKDIIYLKWSTPKSTSLELQFCTSAYRVTPSNVTSRPTICLINFVLSGKSVLLEQSRKGPAKVLSHILSNHGGSIFLHSIPTCRPYLDEPPSISEGWGGRITDYRICDFSELVLSNLLFPSPVDRTKIPDVFPIEKAMTKLEQDTRYWPMVYNDTILYTVKQELTPLPDALSQSSLSEVEVEQCRRVVLDLQAREAANESLTVPSTGGRNKGVRRDEQYRSLWGEIETLAKAHSTNSEAHRLLFEFIIKVVSSSPSNQQPRKIPSAKSENTGLETPVPGYKTEMVAWQELDKYQEMTEREKRDFNHGDEDVNNCLGKWKLSGNHTSTPPTMPVPAQPTGSLLNLWTSRQKSKASSSHVEFAGRSYGKIKAELYPQIMRGSNMIGSSLNQD